MCTPFYVIVSIYSVADGRPLSGQSCCVPCPDVELHSLMSGLLASTGECFLEYS